MGYPMNFYIDLDIKNKLDNEENKSKLVTNLLREHYKTCAPLCDVKQLRECEISELSAKLAEKQAEIDKILEIEKEKRTIEERRLVREAEEIRKTLENEEKKWSERYVIIESEPDLCRQIVNDYAVCGRLVEEYRQRGKVTDVSTLIKYYCG